MFLRLLIVVLAVGLGAASFFYPNPKYLAILSALLSAVSGWLSVRNATDEVRVTPRDGVVVVGLRRLIASDRAVALFFIQLALIFQAMATLLQPDGP